jgi:hypothetical protein
MKVHEYLRRILLATENGIIKKGVHFPQVAHDGYCALYSGNECNCNPDITIVMDGKSVEISKDGKIKREIKLS